MFVAGTFYNKTHVLAWSEPLPPPVGTIFFNDMDEIQKNDKLPTEEEIIESAPHFEKESDLIRWLNINLDGPHVEGEEVKTIYARCFTGRNKSKRYKAYEYRGVTYWSIQDIYRGIPAAVRSGMPFFDKSVYAVGSDDAPRDFVLETLYS